MISIKNLSKHYGDSIAVDDLTVDVQPGLVIGFLGPNGAGKTTTMRMILGLDTPTSGTATIAGCPYSKLRAPLYEVGTLIDPNALHTGRTARDHLRWLARAGGISGSRVAEVLELVELDQAADRPVAGFSLGMSQRLGIAAALLGDPGTLILDEPSNGLDPAGMRWMRRLLRQMADQGRTVFVSSHLLAEMQQIADRVIVINQGRLVADIDVEELAMGLEHVKVRSPHAGQLTTLLEAERATVQTADSGPETFKVTGLSAERIGEIAAENRIPLYELTPEQLSLESAFMTMTQTETSAE